MERTVYRIIDANFNRAREGLRVMEEFCRFGLNNRQLSGKAKEIRHRLCDAIKSIEYERLIASRDSKADVGSDLVVEGQSERDSLKECFVAAAKRTTEALRAMAEAVKIMDAGLAGVLEKLRFEVYTFEKEVVQVSFARKRFENVRLYVIISVEADDQDEQVLNMVEKCCAGQADCIQLRCKGVGDLKLLELAKRFVEICRSRQVISIINDRADIAVLSGADGVHAGRDDLPAEQIRKLGTRPLIVGGSTHSVKELKEAISTGVDYVGIGPAFKTTTKPGLKAAGLEYIKQAVKMLEGTGIGHVAIGGVGLENVESVINAGAKAAAVCSAITDAADPEKATGELKNKISKVSDQKAKR